MGNEQTKLPEPLCSVSILTYHDSAELFLQLITDSLKINKPSKNPDFIGYWDLIQKSSHITLTHKNEMQRLNKTRVNLKHYGTFPAKIAIEEAKIFINLFFEENTRQIYGLEYSQLSLVELVTFEVTRNNLLKAETELKSKNYIDAIQSIVIAYHHLIEDYEKKKVSLGYQSPFYFGGSVNDIKKYSCYVDEDKLSEEELELFHYVETMYRAIQEISDALTILALGMDYKKYSKFISIVPNIDRMKYTSWDPKKELSHITENDVDYCLNFVIECALKFQEFDYEMKHNKKILTLEKWY